MREKPFRVVPYHPEDYSLGERLALPSMTDLTHPSSISGVLSLYFQWEEYRSSHIRIAQKDKEFQIVPCELDYDRDSAFPIELKVSVSKFSEFELASDRITIRLEVFRVGYEFETKILFTHVGADRWEAIVSVPDSVKVMRERKLPRFRLRENEVEKFPLKWSSSGDSGEKSELKLVEIGMNSIRAEFQDVHDRSNGTVLMGGLKIPGNIVRLSNKQVVICLEFSDSVMFGAYFDLYRKFAYPHLRNRYEKSFEEGLRLYSDTNYFGQQEGEKSAEQKVEIENTWESLRAGNHLTNVDHYVVDDEGHAVGTSGIALSHYQGNTPVWIFHQLCALKKPDLVLRSGQLYTWRAEYLAARPENLEVAVWFNSKSRWLERIYVKHTVCSSGGAKLFPLVDIRYQVEKMDSVVNSSLQEFNLGSARRVNTTGADIWGAAGPKCLNANQNLNMVVAVFGPTSISEVKQLSSDIMAKLGDPELAIKISLPVDSDVASFAGYKVFTDRMGYFPKGDLVSLLVSIEHSMAVTERKLRDKAIS